jgi:hypothetical protein
MNARTNSIRVRVSPQEEATLLGIGLAMSKTRSGIRNPDGSINVSAVIRALIREEKIRRA